MTLSVDHKPNREDERKRFEALGGTEDDAMTVLDAFHEVVKAAKKALAAEKARARREAAAAGGGGDKEDAEAWRKSVEITISGRGVPKPCMTFEEASMPSYVQDEVLKCGFDKPTPIQSQGWPLALSGRDVVGISRTGSGKTLAFLLPGVVHINAYLATLSTMPR